MPRSQEATVKIFIDSADPVQIKKAVDLGLCDGVTTNPSLIAKQQAASGDSHEKIIGQICSVCDGPVLAEVLSVDYEGIVKEAGPLGGISKNVVIKIPMTQGGLQACRTLSEKGIQTAVTLIFNSSQALLAAKSGATYIAPFVGRIDDLSNDGMEMISDVMTIYSNYDVQTQVIVASVRSPEHFHQSALIGAHAITVPFSMVEKLSSHPLTDLGIAKFLSDAGKQG
jgi:transaldolase